MKLTDTQLVLLSAASQREDGGVMLAPNLKGSAASKVVGKLLRDGLIEEVSSGGSLPVWRRDGDAGPLALRITKRGLATIGVDGDALQAAEGVRTAEQGVDGSPKTVERRRGIRLRSTQRRPVAANRSRTGCLRYFSVHRAQPSQPS
jgi:hypothetical protein